MDHRKRLAHAHRYLKALNRSIRVFTKGHPYVVGLKYEPEERCYVARIRQKRPIPDRWALVVGDIVHNFRSSLDSLTYALALAHSGVPDEKAVKLIQFPICEEAGEFFGTKARPGQCKRRLSRLSPAAQAAIERLQPYNGRMKGFRHALSVLSDLANIDKHRHIIMVTQAATSSSVSLVGPSIDPGTTARGLTGVFVDGAILAKWAFRGSLSARSVHPKVHVDPHLGFDVAFGKGPPAHGGSVFGFLDNLHEFIRDKVFPPLEALL